MLLLKILFAFLTVGSVGLADYTGYNAWFALTGIAGIQWAKMEIFEIAYGATAAAIKDYETTGAEIEDAIEAVGAWVLFLPPYSPDLNPIENCWSKVKAILRALKPRSFDALQTALVEAFAAITTQDIRGWFGHCGYRGART